MDIVGQCVLVTATHVLNLPQTVLAATIISS